MTWRDRQVPNIDFVQCSLRGLEFTSIYRLAQNTQRKMLEAKTKSDGSQVKDYILNVIIIYHI